MAHSRARLSIGSKEGRFGMENEDAKKSGEVRTEASGVGKEGELQAGVSLTAEGRRDHH